MQYQQYSSEGLRECVNTCLQCFAECTETIQQSLVRGGKQADKHFIGILSLVADSCQLTATSLLMNSPYYGDFCELCAKVCSACADTCNSMNDIALDECAEICRKTARACIEMHAEAEEWKWARREAEAGSTMHI